MKGQKKGDFNGRMGLWNGLPLLVLLGPLFFLCINALLFTKTAPHLGSLVWLFGIAVTTLLSCGISYLVYQEIGTWRRGFELKNSQKNKEAEDLRSVLDETHRLYRDKVAKLEAAIGEVENEQMEKLQGSVSALAKLQEEFDELFDKAGFYKNQAHSFQIALEDALDEVRELSHMLYLNQDQKAPKELLSQHQQLREQFEEKSVVLDETRRRLFATESFLLALKKERGFELLDLHQEQELLIKAISELLEENDELEKENIALENLISLKPLSHKKTAKKLEEMLEFQFDNAT